jgi:DNA-binding FrmR family transcriptional regulator
MKRILMAAAVLATVTFAGCNAGGGDPKAVLLAFFEAMGKKDFVAAKKLATKDSESMFSMIEMAAKMGGKENKSDMNFEKDKMIFGEAKIDGDKATVEVKDKEKGEGINFTMKKEGGSWKVAFDKASMMQMGMEKMNEKGMDTNAVLDSVSSGLDKLKDINMDSLTDKLKEGVDKLNENKGKIEEAAKKLEEAAQKVKQ